MGEIAITLLKWISRFTFIMAGILAFIVLLNVATSALFVGFNAGAFGDVYAIVSIWMPFNLPVVMLWLFTAATAYIGYRMALTALIWLNRFIGA